MDREPIELQGESAWPIAHSLVQLSDKYVFPRFRVPKRGTRRGLAMAPGLRGKRAVELEDGIPRASPESSRTVHLTPRRTRDTLRFHATMGGEG